MMASTTSNKPPAKRFRFDSFATEFGNVVENNPVKNETDMGDNDSGIGKCS